MIDCMNMFIIFIICYWDIKKRESKMSFNYVNNIPLIIIIIYNICIAPYYTIL